MRNKPRGLLDNGEGQRTMNKRVVTIGAVALLSGMVWGQREVTRFNDGWKFAAFGEQADGTMVAEPDAMSACSGWCFPAPSNA